MLVGRAWTVRVRALEMEGSVLTELKSESHLVLEASLAEAAGCPPAQELDQYLSRAARLAPAQLERCAWHVWRLVDV